MPYKIGCLEDNGQQRAVWKRLRLSHNELFLITPLLIFTISMHCGQLQLARNQMMYRISSPRRQFSKALPQAER